MAHLESPIVEWIPSALRSTDEGRAGWLGVVVALQGDRRERRYYTARVYATHAEALRAAERLIAFLRGDAP
jgi:hypothetical protein